MIRAAILIAAALVLPAHAAETYGIVTFGKAHFANPEGVWQNFAPIAEYGYGTVANEKSNTWALGMGRRYGWGSVEVTYQDFGETKSYAAYPYDPGSSALPANCNYPCTPPQWVYHYGTAQGVNFTAAPRYEIFKGADVFVKGGLTFYRATFKYYVADNYNDPNAKSAAAEKWDPTFGVTPTYGFGIRVKSFVLDVMRYHDIRAKDAENGSGNFQRIDTVTLSLQIPMEL